MGENSKIEWCDHTFNAWTGCTKVSEGCAHCYAEDMSRRFRGAFGQWGDNGTRVVTSEANWRKPLKWDREAKAVGRRARVFTNSLADVFEDRPELEAPRARLYKLIRDTPNLDWLLLTKRPENIAKLTARALDTEPLPRNAQFGASVENQDQADRRVVELLSVRQHAPRVVLFLSCEPLLSHVDLRLTRPPEDRDYRGWSEDGPIDVVKTEAGCGINWVICGGESGRNARPMHPDWARSLRDQCKQAGVPFLFKQWGEWAPIDRPWKDDNPSSLRQDERWLNLAGGSGFHGELVWRMRQVGKVAAGRLLDGVEHNEFPRVEVPGHA